MANASVPDGMDIEWLIIADAAQVTGGKLYLLGGGWDRLNVRTPLPLRQHMALAVSIYVPWNHTNERHALQLDFQDEDGTKQATVGGEFEVGRPPGTKPGQPQRIQLVLQAEVEVKKFGVNSITASIDDVESRRTSYSVVPTPELEAFMAQQRRQAS